jgi:DNA polymerase-2
MATLSEGWLFDVCQADDRIALWIYTSGGDLVRLEDEFHPKVYVDDPRPEVQALGHYLERRGVLASVSRTEKLDFWSGAARAVWEWEVAASSALRFILKRLVQLGCQSLYNCDVPAEQYYLYTRRLFPFCRLRVRHEAERVIDIEPDGSPWDASYRLPSLQVLQLRLSRSAYIPLGKGNALVLEWDGRALELLPGSRRELVQTVNRFVQRIDPDLVLSEHGDTVIIPALLDMAARQGVPLALDRDRIPTQRRIVTEGKSYFSYGQVLYKGPSYPLIGRWHIDRKNSFIFAETGLEGTAELARLSKIPVQRLARTSPGSAMSSMQLNRAVEEGILIPWRKSEPEAFKSAWDLLVADKGGLVFQPPIGVFEQVAEIDYSQMYPTIMVRHNISPETVLCRCCDNRAVPEVGYAICEKREGLVPKTLRPVLAKRKAYKQLMKAAEGQERELFDARQTAIKWALVSAFGYLGYRNARFGRIEAHEAVTAFGREKLLQAKEIVEAHGYRVLHALTDSLWMVDRRGEAVDPSGHEARLVELCRQISAAADVEMSLEGVYDWFVFLPSKIKSDRPVPGRYFGRFGNGEVKARGLVFRRHDMPPFIREAQLEMLAALCPARSRSECVERLPAILDVFRDYASRLKEGRVAGERLLIARRLTKDPSGYKVENMTALAAKQLEQAGVKLHAGQRVRYVVRDADAGDKRQKIIAEPFLGSSDDDYDAEKYLELLREAAEEIFGAVASQGRPGWQDDC